MTDRSKKILVGKKAILDYLQFSEYTFLKFVRRGLPVSVIENRYYAHTDNLDLYFQKLTISGGRVVKDSE
jgi:hypothetical protein